MTQHNTLNVKLPTLQPNKLKLEIKNGTEITLKISSNVVVDSNDENTFPHKLLLINTQVWKLFKAFANGSSANIKLSKTHLDKIGQSGGCLGLLVIGNVLKILVASVLIPLRLTAAATSAADATTHKKCLDLVRWL